MFLLALSMAASGAYIFTLVHLTGTSADSTIGIPGKKIDSNGVDVVMVKNNKLADHWAFDDDTEIQKQLLAIKGGKSSDSAKKKDLFV